MKKILDLITDEETKAFTDCGYDAKYGNVGVIFNGVDCFNNFIQFYCIVAVRFVYSSHIDRKINKRAPFFFSDFRGFHLGSQEYELWNRGWLWL